MMLACSFVRAQDGMGERRGKGRSLRTDTAVGSRFRATIWHDRRTIRADVCG
jgi:hypothetical protein